MKKLKIIILSLILCFSFNLTFKTQKVKAETENLSKSAILIDANSNTVISSYNENERYTIASMTKIMLLLLFYENLDKNLISFDEDLVISKNASSMGGSQVFLEENGTYKVGELIKAITIASANDASVAIAERLYGTEEQCVEKMNEKVKELNLKNTLFSNCTGLPKPNQYSSAYDISQIFLNLIKHKEYFNYSTIWLDKIEHKNGHTEISNTNKLSRFYEGCDGGKTGHTNESGYCLTATAKRGNMRLISCVIGAKTSSDRFKEVSNMFNNGFNNYTNKVILDSEYTLEEQLKIEKGKTNQISVKPEKDFFVFSKRNVNEKITVEYEYFKVIAPISVGDKVGKATIYKEGIKIGEIDLISNESVLEKKYFDYFKQILENYA